MNLPFDCVWVDEDALASAKCLFDQDKGIKEALTMFRGKQILQLFNEFTYRFFEGFLVGGVKVLKTEMTE